MILKDNLWVLVRIRIRKTNQKVIQILGCFDHYLYAEMYAYSNGLEKEEFVIERLPYLEPIDGGD